MTQSDLDGHIRAMGIGHLVYGALILVPAVIVYVVLTVIGAVSGDPDAEVVLPLIAVLVGSFLVLLGLPSIIAGIAVLKKKSWGLPFAMVMGILHLLSFPFGTALGAYSIWIFLEKDKVKKAENAGIPAEKFVSQRES